MGRDPACQDAVAVPRRPPGVVPRAVPRRGARPATGTRPRRGCVDGIAVRPPVRAPVPAPVPRPSPPATSSTSAAAYDDEPVSSVEGARPPRRHVHRRAPGRARPPRPARRRPRWSRSAARAATASSSIEFGDDRPEDRARPLRDHRVAQRRLRARRNPVDERQTRRTVVHQRRRSVRGIVGSSAVHGTARRSGRGDAPWCRRSSSLARLRWRPARRAPLVRRAVDGDGQGDRGAAAPDDGVDLLADRREGDGHGRLR